MFIPKGTVIIGKIHRHQHLNFILQGKVSVATEFGKKYFDCDKTGRSTRERNRARQIRKKSIGGQRG
jgi:hypothetical protein